MTSCSNQDFQTQLLSVAFSLARSYSKEQLDLHTLWLAFLFLAKSGSDDVQEAVETYAPGINLNSIDFPTIDSAPDVPMSHELRRLFGPLGLFTKDQAKKCTPQNFIPVIQIALCEGVKFPEDTIPANFPRDSQAAGAQSMKPRSQGFQTTIANGAEGKKPLASAIAELRNRLQKEVFGQGPTTDLFVDSVGRAMARPREQGSLRWSSLLFGPHGSGKSQALSVMKKWLEDHRSVLPIKRFLQIECYLPGSLHSLRHQLRESSEPGVLVVSEIDKLTSEVSNVLLEGLSSAELQLPHSDQLYRTSIEGWIVIMTGNIGRRFWSRLPFREKECLPTIDQMRDVLEKETNALLFRQEKVLTRAFLDRIETFLPFGQLRYADMMQVVNREVDRLVQEMSGKGVTLEVENFVKELVTFQASFKRTRSGRRGLIAFREHIESPVRNLEVNGFKGSVRLECGDSRFRQSMTSSLPRILVVDDEADDVVEKIRTAVGNGVSIDGFTNIDDASKAASKEKYDLMFLDMYFEGVARWRDYLKVWRLAFAEVPVVLFSSQPPSWVERSEIDRLGGVVGFVSKEPQETLREQIEPVLEHARWQARVRQFQKEYGYGGDQVMFDHSIRSGTGSSSNQAYVRFDHVECQASEGQHSSSADAILNQNTQQEIDEFVKLFLDVERRQRFGLKRPRGLLLYGPPGNGKTLIARHLAAKINCNFMAISVGDIRSKYAGEATERLREIFDSAQMRQPCVLFIDEIDGILPARTSDSGGGVERDDNATVGAFLAMLDGFENDSEVFVIGATNRKDSIDPAILRPGRLDRHIEIGKPGLAERKKMLESWCRRNSNASFDTDWAARETYDLSGADVMRVADDSALVALRAVEQSQDMNAAVAITNEHFREAVDRFRFGALPQNSGNRTDESDALRRRVAVHEAGHLVTQHILLGVVPDRLTIIARGDFGGYVRTNSEDFPYRFSSLALTKSRAINEIACLLAGGIAEQIIFTEHCAGVSDDRRRAFKLASQMVSQWGMGSLAAETQSQIGGKTDNHSYGEECVSEICKILDTAQEIAKKKLEENRALLDCIVDAALKQEDLNRDTICRLLGVNNAPNS